MGSEVLLPAQSGEALLQASPGLRRDRRAFGVSCFEGEGLRDFGARLEGFGRSIRVWGIGVWGCGGRRWGCHGLQGVILADCFEGFTRESDHYNKVLEHIS